MLAYAEDSSGGLVVSGSPTWMLSIVVADLTRGCREKGLCLVLSG